METKVQTKHLVQENTFYFCLNLYLLFEIYGSVNYCSIRINLQLWFEIYLHFVRKQQL